MTPGFLLNLTSFAKRLQEDAERCQVKVADERALRGRRAAYQARRTGARKAMPND